MLCYYLNNITIIYNLPFTYVIYSHFLLFFLFHFYFFINTCVTGDDKYESSHKNT